MDHPSFLSDILANPAEDAPRLVYADWLSEQDAPDDRALGEFIRVQYALRDLPGEDPRRPQYLDRERDLLAGWRAAWTPKFPARVVEAPTFLGGFIERAELDLRHPAADLARVLELAPLREVTPSRVTRLTGEDLRKFLDLLAPGRLRAFSTLPLPDPVAEALAGASTLEGLESLATQVGHLGRIAAAGPSWLGGLRSLELGVHGPAAGGLESLPAGLEEFTLLDNPNGPDLPRALASVLPRLPRLRSITWQGSYPVGPSLAWLPLGERLASLEALRLRRVALREQAPLLANSPLLSTVRALELRPTAAGAPALRALARSPHLGRLARLELTGTAMEARGAAHLGAIAAPALRYLDVRSTRLGDDGVRALAGAGLLSQLHGLRVSDNRLTAEGVGALLDGAPERLTLLDLSWNSLGSPGVAALASACPPGLQALDLSYCGLDDDGARALAGCPELDRLEAINLGTNRIGDDGLRALAGSPHLGRLTSLDLANNRITRAGVRALRESGLFNRLEALNVRGNQVPAEELRGARWKFRGILGG